MYNLIRFFAVVPLAMIIYPFMFFTNDEGIKVDILILQIIFLILQIICAIIIYKREIE